MAETSGSVPDVEVDLLALDGTKISGADADFTVELRSREERTDAGGLDVRVVVTHTGVSTTRASVRVTATLRDVENPWWLVPGLFYGENRPEGSFRAYPRFAVGRRDDTALESDHWAFRADRAATPAAFVWGAGRGLALLAAEMSPLGMSGVGFAHESVSGDARVHVTFPYREEPVSYFGDEVPRQADTATWEWHPGECRELDVRLYEIDGDRHGYAPVLREAHQLLAGSSPVEPWVDVEEAALIAAHGLREWHYDPDPGVLLETVGFDREISGQDGRRVDRQAMHVGWVSGIPWAYALLAHARRAASTRQAEAAVHVIDFICSELAPSGTFWGVWYRSTGWTQSWSPVPRALHARTLGEATLFLLRALALGADVPGAHPGWVTAARSNLDVMRGRQRADGNLGALHHAESGEVLSWEGAAGLTWVAALAEAEDLDDGGGYLRAAVRAGEFYAQFVDREFIHGAPEDVGLAPTSEDGYAAVMAYVALHRRTGEPRWLDLARRAADWMLTFRYTYNVTFPPRTPLGVYGFATRGGDNASVSNQHLHAYGLVCTQEMLELSRATGDDHYAARALETLACFRQLIPRVDGELNAYRGMISERYYQTDCFQPKGMMLTLSHAWSVGVLLLGCEQVLGQARGVESEPGGAGVRE